MKCLLDDYLRGSCPVPSSPASLGSGCSRSPQVVSWSTPLLRDLPRSGGQNARRWRVDALRNGSAIWRPSSHRAGGAPGAEKCPRRMWPEDTRTSAAAPDSETTEGGSRAEGSTDTNGWFVFVVCATGGLKLGERREKKRARNKLFQDLVLFTGLFDSSLVLGTDYWRHWVQNDMTEERLRP